MGRAPLSAPHCPPAVPAAAPEAPLPQHWLPGSQIHPPLPPSLMQRGSWAYFILMFLLVSCCFSFPIVYRKEHFPVWGRREGDFPSTARLCITASGEVSWSGARAWLGSGGLCSAEGALSTGLGTGHCGMGLLGSPGTQKLPGFVCSDLC